MSLCIYCESAKVIYKRIPDHRREWKDEISGEEFTEWMPAADDYECVDCKRMWTYFDGDSP